MDLETVLSEISGVEKIVSPGEGASVPVTGVAFDSRKVEEGTLFVAVRGLSVDGHDFVSNAIKRGAAAVVCESPPEDSKDVPVYRVEDTRRALPRLAAAYAGFPSRELLVLGVTGTSGKTTTTYLLESILEAAGLRPGVIGTVNYRYGNHVVPASHTTPDVVRVHGMLAEMREAGCRSVVMEVSSHGLQQGRIGEVAFDGLLFTNLSPEHLDYHTDMEDYFQTKKRLFTDHVAESRAQGKSPVAVVGRDPWGLRLRMELEAELPVEEVPSGILEPSPLGLRGSWAGISIESSLVGSFNGENILGACALARALKIPDPAIAEGIARLEGVPGRLEQVGPRGGSVGIYVDYAHKPDALEKVLRVLRETSTSGELHVVVGCGGDRDRQKRPVMGNRVPAWPIGCGSPPTIPERRIRKRFWTRWRGALPRNFEKK